MDLEGFSFIDKYPEAREKLRDATNNVDYLEYAVNQGPLQISQLEAITRTSPRVQEAIAKYGWPNMRDDGIIEPVQDFATDADFISSLRPIDEYGPRKLISSHFMSILRANPDGDNAEDMPMLTSVLGKMPVVQRAHVLAPDLFDSLRVVLEEFKVRYRDVQPTDEEDYLYEAMIRDENADIVQAMHMAYRILGRLLKTTDTAVWSQARGGSGDAPLILNADNVLRYGNE